ncbi:MAG: hypothetical protein DI556_03155 [Rhodovulum sulfidophilum]|uniref:Uncharacterized protein n=1 Tax=Rhodovulum sulfidophilum TaxID=35806 RepID=A0A2W5NPL2_RHOSU|nr:MAG: hypothetical protein DI556_03155 [Rhodovulum sulfidophilum]
MRQSLALVALLAFAAPAFAQGNNPNAPAARVAGRPPAAAPGVAGGPNCRADSFGAMRCVDGTPLPGGQFGTTPRVARQAAPVAPTRPRPVGQDPVAAIIRGGDPAEEGNLYGDPAGLPRGTDGYGCKSDANGTLRCQ